MNTTDKVKRLIELVGEAKGLAQELVEAGEHAIAPVYRHMMDAHTQASRRVAQVESYEAEQTANSKATEAKSGTPELRTDGPTKEEYVAAGYKAENYPPSGYAPRTASQPPVATAAPASEAAAPSPTKQEDAQPTKGKQRGKATAADALGTLA